LASAGDVRFKDTIRYEIFKCNSVGKLLRVEAVEGFARATSRIEELASNDPTFDYFLYCAEAGRVVRHLQRTSSSGDVLPGDVSQKKAG
jgi:hypothetical protein